MDPRRFRAWLQRVQFPWDPTQSRCIKSMPPVDTLDPSALRCSKQQRSSRVRRTRRQFCPRCGVFCPRGFSRQSCYARGSHGTGLGAVARPNCTHARALFLRVGHRHSLVGTVRAGREREVERLLTSSERGGARHRSDAPDRPPSVVAVGLQESSKSPASNLGRSPPSTSPLP